MWHVIDHHGCSYYCLGRLSQIQNDLDGLVSDRDVKLRSWKVMTLLSGHGNSIVPSKATSLNCYYILIIKPLFFWRVSWWGGHGCKHLFFNIFWRSGHFGENLWSPDEDLPVGAGIPNQIPSRIVGDNHGKSWNPFSLAEDILSFIGILLFVGLKATYVFFSWLNYFLLASGLNVVAISLLVFAIGFLMFMLPIVPGTAVYLFSGVVSWRLWWLACVGGTKSICAVMLSANTYACEHLLLHVEAVGKVCHTKYYQDKTNIFNKPLYSSRVTCRASVCILVAPVVHSHCKYSNNIYRL